MVKVFARTLTGWERIPVGIIISSKTWWMEIFLMTTLMLMTPPIPVNPLEGGNNSTVGHYFGEYPRVHSCTPKIADGG